MERRVTKTEMMIMTMMKMMLTMERRMMKTEMKIMTMMMMMLTMERRMTKTEMIATMRACWLDSGYSNRSQTRLCQMQL